jgi:hypothetical protein
LIVSFSSAVNASDDSTARRTWSALKIMPRLWQDMHEMPLTTSGLRRSPVLTTLIGASSRRLPCPSTSR